MSSKIFTMIIYEDARQIIFRRILQTFTGSRREKKIFRNPICPRSFFVVRFPVMREWKMCHIPTGRFAHEVENVTGVELGQIS